jgi:hypothetical protein
MSTKLCDALLSPHPIVSDRNLGSRIPIGYVPTTFLKTSSVLVDAIHRTDFWVSLLFTDRPATASSGSPFLNFETVSQQVDIPS